MSDDDLKAIAERAGIHAGFAPGYDDCRELLAEVARLTSILAAAFATVSERDGLAAAAEAAREKAVADLAATRAALLAAADRQEAFAGPAYTQHSPEDRRVFRHAAMILREQVARLFPEGGK